MVRFDVCTLAIAGLLTVGATGCGGEGSGSGGGSSTGGSGGATSTASGGSGGAGGATTTSTTSAGGAFVITLTSPSLTEGGMFAADNTCAGLNVSPELDWTPGPKETKSYAVVLKDVTNGLVHSAIWDIPLTAVSLPADLDKLQNPAEMPGSKQAKAYDSVTYGYLGPCPNGTDHTYRFSLYALDVETLPIVGFPQAGSVVDVALEHALVTATLTGHSDASPP